MQEPQKIQPETLKTLIKRVSDPRRLGGHLLALETVGREVDQVFSTFLELRVFFSSMLEEEAVALMSALGARMPDLTKNTVAETVRLMSVAA